MLSFKLRHKTTAKPSCINLLCQNIQGLSGKVLELELFVECNNINIICITEHWLKHCDVSCNVNNFQLSSLLSRKTTTCGGSLILVKNDIKYIERKDIVDLSVERHVEVSCVELKSLVIVCVYRPPKGSFETFESVMEDALKKLKQKNKPVAVCGDFNVDILESSALTTRLLTLFNSFNLVNQFLEPTRVTDHSATCIDNIFSECDPVNKLVVKNITSDHYGLQAAYQLDVADTPVTLQCRPITKTCLDNFKNSIYDKVSLMPYVHDDPNELYGNFFGLLIKEFNNSFKTKTIKCTQKLQFCQWATAGIYKSRNRLYELYKLRESNHSPGFVEHVKQYSKIFKQSCSIAKSNYFKGKIMNSSNKIKTTWDIIKRETGKYKPRDNSLTLKINDAQIKSEKEIADIFNNFFVNIPIETTSNLNSSTASAVLMLQRHVSECSSLFDFKSINFTDIIKAFKSLKMKGTNDLWGISVTILKSIIYTIAPYLAVIFNDCIAEGIFPDLMKFSKIIPLFKSGNKEDPSNYRPISILPALSKIFEKIILEQLLTFFNLNNLLHNKQFGFTKGRSTTDAGVALLKHVFGAWERSQNALGIFCDLSKAFDCVDHQTLLLKLNHYGIKNNAQKLLHSYLSSRTQTVDINGVKSMGSDVKLGVPQGSILGPFLFLVYINDLPFFAKSLCEIVLFADDTSLIFNIDRNKSNFDDVNKALSEILTWFSFNNLQLNAKKTKCVLFSLPNVKSPPIQVVMNNEKLDLVESTVFLGVTIDRKLQWHSHIAALAGKLSSAAYAIRKVRQLTDIDTARTVYFSYFHSIMSYGILMWGLAADINAIFILQKRAVRAIYQLSSKTSLRDKFKEIGILTAASQFILNCILFVRRNINLYTKHGDLHGRNTRNRNNLIMPLYRLEKVRGSFMGQGIHIFNKIPSDILELPFEEFKNHIKNCLLKKGYYTVNDYLNDKATWS